MDVGEQAAYVLWALSQEFYSNDDVVSAIKCLESVVQCNNNITAHSAEGKIRYKITDAYNTKTPPDLDEEQYRTSFVRFQVVYCNLQVASDC